MDHSMHDTGLRDPAQCATLRMVLPGRPTIVLFIPVFYIVGSTCSLFSYPVFSRFLQVHFGTWGAVWISDCAILLHRTLQGLFSMVNLGLCALS